MSESCQLRFAFSLPCARRVKKLQKFLRILTARRRFKRYAAPKPSAGKGCETVKGLERVFLPLPPLLSFYLFYFLFRGDKGEKLFLTVSTLSHPFAQRGFSGQELDSPPVNLAVFAMRPLLNLWIAAQMARQFSTERG